MYKGIRRSGELDAGQSGLGGERFRPRDYTVSPSTVYAAGIGVVSRSTDSAQSWSSLSRGLNERSVTAIAIDTTDHNVLYAAAEGRGLFRYAISGNPSSVRGEPVESLSSRRALPGASGVSNARPRGKETRTPSRSRRIPEHSGSSPENNLELTVKVVDGRAPNGHFWVFLGALSDVAHTVTVRDTQTGATKVYESPQGTLSSVADTAAFEVFGRRDAATRSSARVRSGSGRAALPAAAARARSV